MSEDDISDSIQTSVKSMVEDVFNAQITEATNKLSVVANGVLEQLGADKKILSAVSGANNIREVALTKAKELKTFECADMVKDKLLGTLTKAGVDCKDIESMYSAVTEMIRAQEFKKEIKDMEEKRDQLVAKLDYMTEFVGMMKLYNMSSRIILSGWC